MYIESRFKLEDTYHYIYEEDDDYEMFYTHLLCNTINKNINSIHNLNGIALPPVRKTPEEAV